jgi:hypothetical protein
MKTVKERGLIELKRPTPPNEPAAQIHYAATVYTHTNTHTHTHKLYTNTYTHTHKHAHAHMHARTNYMCQHRHPNACNMWTQRLLQERDAARYYMVHSNRGKRKRAAHSQLEREQGISVCKPI